MISSYAIEVDEVEEGDAPKMSPESIEAAIAARDAMLAHLARKERRAHYKARAIQLLKACMAVEAIVSLVEGCLHAGKHECERPLDEWLISFAAISFTFDLSFLVSSCLAHKHGATDHERAWARILEGVGWLCLLLIIAWCIVGDYWAFVADAVECDKDLRYSVTSISAIALFSLTILFIFAFIYGAIRCARTPGLDRRRQHRRDVLRQGEEALAIKFASHTARIEPPGTVEITDVRSSPLSVDISDEFEGGSNHASPGSISKQDICIQCIS